MKKTKKLRDFWYGMSSNQRFLIRKLYYFPIDLFDKIRGNTNKYVPPRGSIYTGSPDSANNYIKQGIDQLELLKTETNLLPNDSVLDIGSGVGRTAIALTQFIDKNGSYDGFDVVKQGVDWCNKGIGTDFNNFNFKYVPIFNDLYNTSKLKATDFEFPYKTNSFDKVFSFSLFTHMQVDEIQHYFSEIRKVLKPEGLCLSTFFLYDTDNEDYISEHAVMAFPFKKENYRLMNEHVKSGNIALHKDKLKRMLEAANLQCVKIVDGFWKDTVRDQTKKTYQDVVIFKKL
ncbi:MAG: class I SAM-dependent methyltransferase [Gelidibacter sp.]